MQLFSVRLNDPLLQSENRTNGDFHTFLTYFLHANDILVALSRAREGLYILGNHLNLSARSKMWKRIVDELEENDSVGGGFPIICHRHPGTVELVSEPGKLPLIAPDGNVLQLDFFSIMD